MQNVKSITNNHITKVLNNTAEIKESCSCINMNISHLYWKWPTRNIYKASITSNHPKYKNIYPRTAERDFKQRLNNHATSLNLEHYGNNTRANQKILDNKVHTFNTKSYLKNNKETSTFQHNQKKRLFAFPWKVRNHFIQRTQFIEQKVRTY